jgi:hypothetical protein
MAQSSAMVNIVIPHYLSDKPLHHVVIFISALGRANPGKAFGTKLPFDFRQSLGD